MHNMSATIHAALYARVSSERQAEEHTLASQVTAFPERVPAEGLTVSEPRQFLDEGYRGATRRRPALERWRDLRATGALPRLYVHSPDRLARTYAYQVVLVEAFHRRGVAVVCLHRAWGQSPEDALLLQVQGMMAEYERAKRSERQRRGKLPAARAGSGNVVGGAAPATPEPPPARDGTRPYRALGWPTGPLASARQRCLVMSARSPACRRVTTSHPQF
jgi:site-specific DNA recombinase